MRKELDDGKDLGMPDGVLMNGKGPYQYNTTLVPDGIGYETINVEPGKCSCYDPFSSVAIYVYFNSSSETIEILFSMWTSSGWS